MKANYLLPPVLLGVTVCLSVTELSIAALNVQEVETLAKKITIKITGEGLGSGVIIERSGNKYTVLTCRHIFYSGADLNRYQPGKYEVQTSDGQRYPVYKRTEFPGLDLLLLEFESDKTYHTVELANSDKIKTSATTYSAGWTGESSKVGRAFTLTIGYFKERLPKPENGYALVVTNSVLPGMSGGPMLDENGRLIGIHGQVDPRDKSLRLGIPINTFLAARKQPVTSVAEAEKPVSAPNPTPPKPTIPQISLRSSTGTNYSKLRNLLAQGKWREADFETSYLLLALGKRTKQGWLRAEDIEILSCDDLRIIDRLWVAYSEGKFGFSVQKKIYQSLGGKRNYNVSVWNKFGNQIGWRTKERWLNYPELIFNLSAPPGSLPVPVRYTSVDSRKAASIFIDRLTACQL